MTFEYPRPQLERAGWHSLNGDWQFAYDDSQAWREPHEVASWPLQIQVPFPPESIASGIADTGFHTTLWYQRIS
ncbi:MAG: hypothetical protein M3N82_02915 [Pseudomonadota bacterium]|nr:hypothetical protein [Pseudomonadota bacterium]